MVVIVAGLRFLAVLLTSYGSNFVEKAEDSVDLTQFSKGTAELLLVYFVMFAT